jgi:histidinol-phosphatase (PHP family)
LFPYNYHTHSHFSDGSSAPEEYVRSALKSGLKALGFSEHAPVPFENNFAIKNIASLKAYVGAINILKKEFGDKIEIYCGLEADFIPQITLDFSNFKSDFQLDYIIGSVHLVKSVSGDLWFIDGPDRDIWKKGLERYFDNNIKQAVAAYYNQIIEMVSTQQLDIIGHLDKIKMHNHDEYFSESEAWYMNLISDTLEVIKKHDVIVEVNTRGIYKKRSESLFPGIPVLKQMHKLQVPLTISSDAHKPEEVDLLLNETAQILKETGYREIYCFDSGWRSVSLD